MFGNDGEVVVVLVDEVLVEGVEGVEGVEPGDGTPQTALVITLVSKVTAPFFAKSLPSTVAPVVAVMDVKAKIFPRKAEVVPSVAELPTCQKTLQA